jgi:hypothetical protein
MPRRSVFATRGLRDTNDSQRVWTRVLADRTKGDAITADTVRHVVFTWQLMAACGRVEVRNKNDKFIALDLDTDNLYLNQKTSEKQPGNR